MNPPPTDEEILKAAASGTTTKHTKLRLLGRSKTHALIKWPGGAASRYDYIPCWVTLYELSRLMGEGGRGNYQGTDVYGPFDKPGPLTTNAILNLCREHGCEMSDWHRGVSPR